MADRLVKIPCPRCDGKGWIPRYWYNRKGICFRCWGDKYIYVRVPENKTVDEVIAEEKRKEQEHLDAHPPKLPMPENLKNPLYDDPKERAAFKREQREQSKPRSLEDILKDTSSQEERTAKVIQSLTGKTIKPEVEQNDVVDDIIKPKRDFVPDDIMKELEAARKRAQELEKRLAELDAQKAKKQAEGNISVVKTERGTKVKTRFKVVEANDLITSHDDNGNVNPLFPKELQPRDRSRAASEAQIEHISNNLDPELLADSKKASDGAPIIGSDGIVESGNGRTMAIRRAYKKGNKAAEAYRQYLIDNAEEFGLDPEEIKKMKNPVLVRERLTDVDRVQFTREANESGVAALSMGEQAKIDAEKLNSAILDMYEGGDFRKEENRDFVQGFYANVVSQADAGRFWTQSKDGGVQLSDEGALRIRNALFAKAYGDPQLINVLAEARDESNVKYPLEAMVETAGEYAKLREDMERGELYNIDMSKDLASAIRTADYLRREGRKLDTYLSQQSLFGDEISPEEKLLLRFLDHNKRRKQNVMDFILNYVQELRDEGHPDQLSLFGDNEPPTKLELLKRAIRRTEGGEDVIREFEEKDEPFIQQEEQKQEEPKAPADLLKQGYEENQQAAKEEENPDQGGLFDTGEDAKQPEQKDQEDWEAKTWEDPNEAKRLLDPNYMDQELAKRMEEVKQELIKKKKAKIYRIKQELKRPALDNSRWRILQDRLKKLENNELDEMDQSFKRIYESSVEDNLRDMIQIEKELKLSDLDRLGVYYIPYERKQEMKKELKELQEQLQKNMRELIDYVELPKEGDQEEQKAETPAEKPSEVKQEEAVQEETAASDSIQEEPTKQADQLLKKPETMSEQRAEQLKALPLTALYDSKERLKEQIEKQKADLKQLRNPEKFPEAYNSMAETLKILEDEANFVDQLISQKEKEIENKLSELDLTPKNEIEQHKYDSAYKGALEKYKDANTQKLLEEQRHIRDAMVRNDRSMQIWYAGKLKAVNELMETKKAEEAELEKNSLLVKISDGTETRLKRGDKIGYKDYKNSIGVKEGVIVSLKKKDGTVVVQESDGSKKTVKPELIQYVAAPEEAEESQVQTTQADPEVEKAYNSAKEKAQTLSTPELKKEIDQTKKSIETWNSSYFKPEIKDKALKERHAQLKALEEELETRPDKDVEEKKPEEQPDPRNTKDSFVVRNEVFQRGENVRVYKGLKNGQAQYDYGKLVGISHAKGKATIEFNREDGSTYRLEYDFPFIEKDDRAQSEQNQPQAATKVPTWDDMKAMIQKINNGQATADEIKAHARALIANRDAVLQDIYNRVAQDPRFKRRRNSTKMEIAENTFRRHFQNLAHAGKYTFAVQMTGKSYEEDLLDQVIEKLTDEDIKAEYQREQEAAAKEEKAMTNPETLDELRQKMIYKGLTDEEENKMAALIRQEREQQAAQAKAERAAARAQARQIATSDRFNIEEDTHTKTGEKIWVAKLKEKVSREEYQKIADEIRSLGGYYSRFKKGFIFKEDPTAKLNGQAVNQAADQAAQEGEDHEAKVAQKQAQKLREAADNLQSKIDYYKDPNRLTNTARRAAIAAGMEKEGDRLERQQRIMRSLADAIENGEAVHLKDVTQRTQIETLMKLANNLKAERDRQNAGPNSYVDWSKSEARDLTPEDIRGAKMPEYAAHAYSLEQLLKEVKDVQGLKRKAAKVEKELLAQKRQDKMMIDLSLVRNDLEDILAAARKMDGDAKYYASRVTEDLADRKRLEAMGINNDVLYRAALREFAKHYNGTGTSEAEQRQRALKQRISEVARMNIPGYFPTPPEVVNRMIKLADIEPGMKVLEPSAGVGYIADAAKAAGADVDTVEINGTLREILKDKGHNLVGRDFMEFNEKNKYDRIIMNPPFEKGQDIDHVMHAYDLLKPGGKLVAIMSEGAFFRSDKKAKAFQEFMENVGGKSQKLPEGTFKASDRQTGVNTRLVVIEKPKDPAKSPDVKAVEKQLAEAEQRLEKAKNSPALEPFIPRLEAEIKRLRNRLERMKKSGVA